MLHLLLRGEEAETASVNVVLTVIEVMAKHFKEKLEKQLQAPSRDEIIERTMDNIKYNVAEKIMQILNTMIMYVVNMVDPGLIQRHRNRSAICLMIVDVIAQIIIVKIFPELEDEKEGEGEGEGGEGGGEGGEGGEEEAEDSVIDLFWLAAQLVNGLMCDGYVLGIKISDFIPGYVPVLHRAEASLGICAGSSGPYPPELKYREAYVHIHWI